MPEGLGGNEETWSPSNEAAAIFDRFVSAAEARDIESLCVENPLLADELRRLHADWILAGSLSDLASSQTGNTHGFERLLDRLVEREPSWKRYVLEGEIARGGMGIVCRAFDSLLLRTVALKLTRGGAASLATADLSLARFFEEAQVTSQLDHPGIVPVHDLGLDAEGRVFFAMKLVRGEDLGKIFAAVKGNDPEWNRTRVIAILLRVCEAMSYAHDKGVIHRDLKPGNVMVGRYGEAYVMDWGVARVVTPDTSRSAATSSGLRTARNVSPLGASSPYVTVDGDVLGTPAYMAPEQAEGSVHRLGPWTDVYSVGAMLYELLSGRTPHVRDGETPTPQILVMRARKEHLPRLLEIASDVPPDLVAICERATARAPEKRYPSMKEFGDDLRAYLENRVVRAHRTGAIAELRSWFKRNKRFATLGLVAFSAVVVLTALFVRAVRMERDAARVSEARVLRLSDVKELHELEHEADELWPADPQHAVAMRNWLERVDRLVSRRSIHAASLDALASSDLSSDQRGWWKETLTELLAGLDRLEGQDPRGTTRIAVAARLSRATSIEKRSITDHASEWKSAIEDVQSDPRYRALKLSPQLGLVPIGRDPDSHLLEFWHVESGARPNRDPSSGRLSLVEDTGLVLVLLQGGDVMLGEDLDVAVQLDPFFISKYEMTQAQWEELTGNDPTWYSAGEDLDGIKITPLDPVENVSWSESDRWMRRLGLSLPTEAQWEYACRAGTTSTWWTGDRRDSLRGAANLADAAAARSGMSLAALRDWPGFDDGFPVHAPVDRLLPNAFGLHHSMGNVAEWCLDPYVPDGVEDVKTRPGDGLVESVTAWPFHATRGGDFTSLAFDVRSAARKPLGENASLPTIGLRPARALKK